MKKRGRSRINLDVIIEAVYKGILKRRADPEGKEHYLQMLREVKQTDIEQRLAEIIGSFLESAEFKERLNHHLNWVNEAIWVTPPERLIVFLHIHKTAGSSVYLFLQDNFERVSPFYKDNFQFFSAPYIYLKSLEVLSGHISYDAVKEVYSASKRELWTFTFLRQPIDRLRSLYTFFHLHDPSVIKVWKDIKLAIELAPAEYFRHPFIRKKFWNHSLFFLLGGGVYNLLRDTLLNSRPREVPYDIIRKLITIRLRGISFIGFKESIDDSIKQLSILLGTKPPKEAKKVNVTRAKRKEFGFRDVPIPEFDNRAMEAMRDMTRLEQVLYNEARVLESKRRPLRSQEREETTKSWQALYDKYFIETPVNSWDELVYRIKRIERSHKVYLIRNRLYALSNKIFRRKG